MDPEPSSIAEEAECFEDPCYVPDPMSLLGPVYEALDNFPLDLGDSFLSNNKVEEPQILMNAPASGNIAKPSPIESPVSRLQVSEKHTAFGLVSCISMSQDSHTMNEDDSQGTWQMWETRLPQDSLGFVGGSSSWLLPIGQNKFRQEEISNLISDCSITSQSTKESPAFLGTESPQHIHDGNLQNGMTYGPHVASDPWTPLQAFPVDGVDHFLPHSLIDNMQHTDTTDISPIKSTPDCSFELSPMSCWFSPPSVCTKEWPLGGPQEDKISDLAKQNIGGSLNGQEMNSVRSFSQKETIQNITETMSMKANTLTSFEEI